jgi:hypothetical protein
MGALVADENGTDEPVSITVKGIPDDTELVLQL